MDMFVGGFVFCRNQTGKNKQKRSIHTFEDDMLHFGEIHDTLSNQSLSEFTERKKNHNNNNNNNDNNKDEEDRGKRNRN